jgi:hypothetical protein
MFDIELFVLFVNGALAIIGRLPTMLNRTPSLQKAFFTRDRTNNAFRR